MSYKYRDIEQKDIGLIEHLWEGNRNFHEQKSSFFSYEYKDLQFAERMNAIFANDKIKSRITIASDAKDDVVGYCLSVIANTTGEVCTLFVDEKHRGQGIGKILMDIHLEWLRQNECQDVFVDVLTENENTIKFYEKVGFKPNILNMKIPREK